MNTTRNILFVDDEENVLKALKRLFIDEELNIYTASSAKEGLNLLSTDEFAVVVSDQRMPEMTGTEFLLKVKELYPLTLRIILTGYADINAAMDAINEAGASRYITKPWNDRELLHIIKQAVGQYNIVKENIYLSELTKQQKEELDKWSKELEYYVQIHTIDLTKKNKEIKLLNDKLQKSLSETINALIQLIGLRNKAILEHSKRVGIIVAEIAKKLSLSDLEIDLALKAAHLHDIGKIGLSDIVVFKEPQELSKEEMSQYLNHSINGQQILNSIEDLHKVGLFIRHHHEHFDGSGFPDRLKGEKIPLISRIISLADRFERLSKFSDIEDALKRVWLLLGKEFDPELFHYLEIVVNEQKINLFSSDDIIEAELSLNALEPGFIVSRDVFGSAELVIIKKDTVLTEKTIELLKVSLRADSIFVYKKRK